MTQENLILSTEEVQRLHWWNTNTPNTRLTEFWIDVQTFDAQTFQLQGHRFENPDRQPLILFPGFFQNAFVYDLSDDISLGNYLHQNGYDIWMVHQRGTAKSGGKQFPSSLDDYASDDIPAIIAHVNQETGKLPIFVGHSQGGITAMMSLMGAKKLENGTVILSDEESTARQSQLKGLVTLGSFLNFTYSKESVLKDFVANGLEKNVLGIEIKIISSQKLVDFAHKLNFVPLPLSLAFREKLLSNAFLTVLLLPLKVLLDISADLNLWQLLYNIPNVSNESRKLIFYKTIEGTFSNILQQFYNALKNEGMTSLDGTIKYYENYGRISLPASIVAMENDTFADPVTMKAQMFDSFASTDKHFTEWKGLGHEDHFMNTEYFPMVLEAISQIDTIFIP